MTVFNKNVHLYRICKDDLIIHSGNLVEGPHTVIGVYSCGTIDRLTEILIQQVESWGLQVDYSKAQEISKLDFKHTYNIDVDHSLSKDEVPEDTPKDKTIGDLIEMLVPECRPLDENYAQVLSVKDICIKDRQIAIFPLMRLLLPNMDSHNVSRLCEFMVTNKMI